jgi:hypothetical protein
MLPRVRRCALQIALISFVTSCGAPDARQHSAVRSDQVYRVTTAVPFPRGLELVDGRMYVLARGRGRESGGADGAIDDRAGTIYVIDPEVGEPIASPTISERVRRNAQVFAVPTSPPFKLFDRNASPPTNDRQTDRPYCGLRYDPATRNFFVCAFSGIDKPERGGGRDFIKNRSDAVLRFDTRSSSWHVVERHDGTRGETYPHRDPANAPPPHGWTKGPDNCLVVGKWLYVVAKENSVLVAYDLSEIRKNPDAPPPPARVVMDFNVPMRDGTIQKHWGHSMLAARDGFLYVGFRTSSTIIRLPLNDDGLPKQPLRAELIARFDPYDERTRKSANLTDMVFDPDGDLYVVSAQPSRVFRFRPDLNRVFDGRSGRSPPWADMARLTGNASMKSENLLVDARGRAFVTSGDAYDARAGTGGAVYRIDP